MDVNPIRCDQCAKRHRKCNRIKPKCDRCQRLNINCTYLNKSQITRNLLGLEKNLKTFRMSNNEMKDDVNDQAVSCLGSNWRINEFKQKRKNINIPKNISEFDKNSTPLKFLSHFAHMNFLECYLSVLQYPSPYKMSKELKIILWISKTLQLSLKYITLNHPLPLAKNPSISQLPNLLNLAVNNFLRFCNRAYPMFIEENFDFFNRSIPLRLAILAAGLYWVQNDSDTTLLLSYLESKIYQYIKILPRLPPTLETIQLLLIELIWIKIPARSNEFFQTLAHCCFISDIIGLHLSPNLSNPKRETERALTYSSLVVFNLGISLVTGSYLSWPTKPIRVTRNFNNLTKGYTSYILENTYSLSYKSNMVLSSFYCDVAALYMSLRLLKNRYLLNITPLERLDKLTEILNDKINQVNIKYSITYKNLCLKKEYLEGQIDYILFICYFMKFYIYSLYFYLPNFNVTNQLTNKEQKILLLAIDYAQKAIQHGCQAPYYLVVIFGVPNIFHCISFLLNHENSAMVDISDSIKKVKDFTDKVKGYKGNQGPIILNESIMYTIQEVNKGIKKPRI